MQRWREIKTQMPRTMSRKMLIRNRAVCMTMMVGVLCFIGLGLPLLASIKHTHARSGTAAVYAITDPHTDSLENSVTEVQEPLSPATSLTHSGDDELASSDISFDDDEANTDFSPETAESDQLTSTKDRTDYHELFSLTTRDRKFFSIYFAGDQSYNPNIIPHPTKHDMWIVVAQHEQSKEIIEKSEELVCTAGFLNDVLVCTDTPTPLPIADSIQGVCADDLAYLNFRSGPRDARMFYGPGGPLLIYGSQSQYACLGIWVQDIRMMLDAFRLERFALSKLFTSATEVRRPAPWKGVEKNFFFFWDATGQAFVHHDIYPQRVFAQLDYDGSVGDNLATVAALQDQICLAQYMPTLGPEQESIHQATNSLAITMCKRSDPKCEPNDHNTFIMHIFHHKTYYDFHGIYEPYIMIFSQTAPFGMHAISQRPFWIHGRSALTKETASLQYIDRPESDIPQGHTEMFYITSMSWKSHGQRYHGYMDDVLFLSFGIEDTRAGAIDVLAGDLLQDLAFC